MRFLYTVIYFSKSKCNNVNERLFRSIHTFDITGNTELEVKINFLKKANKLYGFSDKENRFPPTTYKEFSVAIGLLFRARSLKINRKPLIEDKTEFIFNVALNIEDQLNLEGDEK